MRPALRPAQWWPWAPRRRLALSRLVSEYLGLSDEKIPRAGIRDTPPLRADSAGQTMTMVRIAGSGMMAGRPCMPRPPLAA